MSTPDAAARRERAEKFLNGDNQITVEESDWARGLTGNFDDDYGVLIGYLAGSREEAAIKDAEIGRLESLLDRARPLARKNLEQAAEIEELKAEIAALREFVRWHFMHHPQSWPGNAEIMPAVRRALGESDDR